MWGMSHKTDTALECCRACQEVIFWLILGLSKRNLRCKPSLGF